MKNLYDNGDYSTRKLKTIGNWYIQFRNCGAAGVNGKLIRRIDGKVDISQKDSICTICSAYKLNNLYIDFTSENAKEPRPFYYYVSKLTIEKLFPDIDKSFIEWLDGKRYIVEKKN